MKKTKLTIALSGLMIATAVIISSCQKKNSSTTTPDTSTTSSTDNNTAQQSSHDVTNFGSEGIESNNGTGNGSLSTYKLSNGGGLPAPMSGSVSVSINTANKNMTVTFINYVGYDGHTRNGTIYYDWSTSTNNAVWYRDSGLVLNVSTPSNNYTVDNYTVHINSKQIKNIGRVGGQLTWTDNSNITITKPSSGGTIQWQGNWTIALLNTGSYTSTTYDGTAASYTYTPVFHGYGGTIANSISWAQALVSVNGTFNGTASDGETYSGNITSPLILNLNCTPPGTRYLYVSGVLNFTPTGKTTRVINYGSGTCDLTYTITIGSWSATVTI
jgi:hypothetical protein